MKAKKVDKTKSSAIGPRRELTAAQELAARTMLIVLTAFFMSVIIEIGRFGLKGFFLSLANWIVWVQMLCVTGVITLVLMTMLIYVMVSRKDTGHVLKKQVRISMFALIVTFIISIGFAILFNNVLIMPLALSGLLIASLVGRRAALIINVLLNQAFYISYILQFGNDQLMKTSAALLAGVVSGTLMILMMSRTPSRIRFLAEGILVGLIAAVIGMLTTAIGNITAWQDVLLSGMWCFLSSFLAVALFLVVVPLFEMVFNVSTNFRLYELCSFDQPLLKRLATEAPGTFNHSLVVASLAELCALSINENPVLCKAAGLYHDVGKIAHPECFIENQKDGENPHDNFIPEVSVKLITDHALYGYDICREYHLPDIVADVTIQHHGTTAVNYFYYKVKSITDATVNKDRFVYAGPKPSGKVAALIMIVDTVEAATRANENEFESRDDYKKFVHALIKAKEEEGQFAECDLTTSDLANIETTLTDAVPTMYHKRIKYDNK